MSFLRIFVNDTEIDFVKETLTIKKENNALISNFKVSHSSYPFLIIENDKTLEALGPREITSINKSKIIPVKVIELGAVYYGELQVLTFLKGFRKCNLKYSTDLIQIYSKPINTFLPTVSVIPDETDPEPYVTEAAELVDGYENWDTYPIPFLLQNYPQVKYNFPLMYWRDRIEDFDDAPEWANYNQEINRIVFRDDVNEEQFIPNSFFQDETEISVSNKNVPAPQLYLLSPLYYALQSIGFDLAGNFTTNPFIRRLLILSQEDNLTKVELTEAGLPVDYGAFNFSFLGYGVNLFFVNDFFPISDTGEFRLKYKFTIAEDPTPGALALLMAGPLGNASVVFQTSLTDNGGENYVLEGYIDFNAGNAPTNIAVSYYSKYANAPISYEASLIDLETSQEFALMHPTIDLNRYAPKWNVGEYINQLKKTFNLDVTIDDFKKKLYLNFNEDVTDSRPPEILKKSLKIESYDIAAHTSFLLKYNNDEDVALYITRAETKTDDYITDTFTNTITSRFKFVPRNTYTALLSEDLKTKSGAGLMIYDPLNKPYISESFNGQNLTIHETGGLYDTYFKKWLKFRLNASLVELTGPFTEVEIAKFNNAKEIYIDNQHYKLVSMQLKETASNNIAVSFSLESVNL